MRTRLLHRIMICVVLITSVTTFGYAQQTKYKEYQHSPQKTEYFEISFDNKYLDVTARIEGEYKNLRFALKSIKKDRERVLVDGQSLFDGRNLHLGTIVLPLTDVYNSRADELQDHVVVTFFRRADDATRTSRLRRGNIIESAKRVIIEDGEFVRGMIFSVSGDIEVFGEVNQDIICLFGDVYIGPSAVVRGDVVSVTGRVDVSREASIYGEVYTGKHEQRRRYRQWYRREYLNVAELLDYNRVDGFRGGVKAEFHGEDSLLPRAWMSGSYAFESERWRYSVGLEQVITRRPALAIGGEYYRRLATGDDRILGRKENTAFALLATEDFRDYYEAEGGSLYLRCRPTRNLTLESRFRYEETNWLQAHSHLFSLFGGNKTFRDNFSSVDSAFREIGIREIDSTANSSISARIEFNTHRDGDSYSRSAWITFGEIEWSAPDLDSDFDYRRYTFGFSRYQTVNRRAMLIFSGRFGDSDGYLPMYKRFFVGGLGTLRGYRHKEFMGTSFWMANAEYRVGFRRSDLALSVLWDVAQIANDEKLDESVEVLHSLGVALYLGSDFRISLSKRLDRSHHNNPRTYVRLTPNPEIQIRVTYNI